MRSRTSPLTLALLLAMSVGYTGPGCPFYDPFDPDRDGDGFPESEDCRDCIGAIRMGCSTIDARCEDVHPDAEEVCNGIDDDCNGEVDDDTVDPNDSRSVDLDGDGFSSGEIEEFCDSSAFRTYSFSGCTTNTRLPEGDCNDNDADVHPEAEDACGDGVDDNCDGIDPECPEVDDDDDGADDDDSGF